MRRFAWIALCVALGCGEVSRLDPGPTQSFYRPMGIGVYGGRVVVASSNFDLRYDDDTGGSVITVDPAQDPVRWIGGINIRSFAGEMAIADPADPRGPAYACPGIAAPVAIVPVRGSAVVYRIALAAGGAPSCEGCELSLAGNEFTDPFSAGVACGPGLARAYVGHLRSFFGRAWITQIDLTSPDPAAPGAVLHGSFGTGQMRGFAYDPVRKRLYAAQTATGSSTVVRWIDLAGGCRFGAPITEGGCAGGAAGLPPGIEPHGIALSRADGPEPFQRLYIAARVFDPVAAAAAGVRLGETDGLLVVADLVDDLAGQTRLHIVREQPIGFGAGALALLPGRPGLRDIVAVLAQDDGVLWLYDDETDALVQVGRVPATGHPLLGAAPVGLAVDPVAPAGVARVYVGSFQEGFVTPIDVPLADIDGVAVLPRFGGGVTP